MSSYSDELSLYLVTTTIELPVVAKNETDAESIVYENYSDIVEDLLCVTGYNVASVLEIQAYEEVVELPENSKLRNITPHGDFYGGQYTCEYYTQVEKEKRKKENNDRKNKIQSLIGSLDSESLDLLRDYFLDTET